MANLRPKVDRLTAELEGRLAFEYKKPNASFDKSKVRLDVQLNPFRTFD